MKRFVPLIVLLSACTQQYDFVQFEGVDVHFQDPPSKVDVLMVVDNSGSMNAWQVLVGLRFGEFLTHFLNADIDYHIGVTTTTVEPGWAPAGCTQEEIDAIPPPGELMMSTYITPDVADAGALFTELVRVGTCGSGDERGLESARLALAPDMLEGANAGFIREDAALSLLFISDEQDASPDPVHEYINDFYAVKGLSTRDAFNASALVITAPEDCAFPTDPANEGSRYAAVVKETGGMVANLCNTNFEEAFTEISFRSARLRDTFFLSEEPLAETIQVSVDSRALSCDDGSYTYVRALDQDGIDRPAIAFTREELPRPNSKIAIRYNLGGGSIDTWCKE